MDIKTGKGTIGLTPLIAVLSLSLVVNIPGLAITPIEGNLTMEFHASDFEVQLLTMLPNICIIPFMLLSNTLIIHFGKTLTSILALAIFTACGVGFFFIDSMLWLIIISCILGASCGVIIPIAASMIADMFYGKYRIKQLGIKSGIANISLVVATLLVGLLAGHGNWRLPFLVYLIPIIPLCFATTIYKAEKISNWKDTSSNDNESVPNSIQNNSTTSTEGKMNKRHLMALMGLYFFITYTVMALPYYLSYDEPLLHINDAWNGYITSIFYLTIFAGGIFLSYFLKIFKGYLIFTAGMCISIGLALIVSGIPGWAMCLCGGFMGFGYGVIQPIIYNKTTEVAQSKRYSTLALSWVMCMNYLSVALAPVIIDSIRSLFGTTSNIFPFYLNAIICGIFCIYVFFGKKLFAFSTQKNYN